MATTPPLIPARFITLIARCSQIYFDRELVPLKISSGQVRILRALAAEDGISQEQIRLASHLDKAAITRAVRPLLSAGYVERMVNPDDKRAYQLFLTAKGRKIMPGLNRAIRAWSDILSAGFSEEEICLLDDLLARMAENACQLLFEGKTGNDGGVSDEAE